MSFVESKDADRRRKSNQEEVSDAAPSTSKGKKRAPEDIGRALRSAYDEAVSESIPPEMLDLLGKLG